MLLLLQDMMCVKKKARVLEREISSVERGQKGAETNRQREQETERRHQRARETTWTC